MGTKTVYLKVRLIFVLALILAIGAASILMNSIPVSAQSEQEKIAYVRGNDATGDEIWLIQPDGTNSRRIWQTGQEGIEGIQDVTSLTWSPNGRELAFSSRHESACSFYYSDIYAIQGDGSGYRRVTSPPACGQRAGMQTGTVLVSVGNATLESGLFVVYFEGAEAPQFVFLSPGETTTVTFNNVADYGDRLQWAVAIYGQYRYHNVLGNANVIPGQTVTTQGLLPISFATYNWGWRWPTWRSDGSQIAYVFQASDNFFSIPANNQLPGEIGQELAQVSPDNKPGDAEFLSYGPTASRANQLLYSAYDFQGEGATIYLIEEGSNNPGQILVEVGQGVGQVVLGISWLPDGSGFLYSATGTNPDTFEGNGNVFAYSFATGNSTRLTNFTSGYTREVSISPDGQKVVFERQLTGDWYDEDPEIDLWMMNINGSSAQLFLESARSPAWGRPAAQQPPSPTPIPETGTRLFLPLIVR